MSKYGSYRGGSTVIKTGALSAPINPRKNRIGALQKWVACHSEKPTKKSGVKKLSEAKEPSAKRRHPALKKRVDRLNVEFSEAALRKKWAAAKHHKSATNMASSGNLEKNGKK